jgi:hypothetical protein
MESRMVKIVYKPREGSILSNEDAQVIGERLTVLAAEGPVKQQDVVDDARMPGSPLHHYFEWDDEIAAEKYRLEQARYYIRSIDIVREENKPAVRAFHNVIVRAEEQPAVRGYCTVDAVLDDRELWQQVLDQERGRLFACQQNLRRYRELESVADGAVQMAIEALDAIKEPATMEVPALVEASA